MVVCARRLGRLRQVLHHDVRQRVATLAPPAEPDRLPLQMTMPRRRGRCVRRLDTGTRTHREHTARKIRRHRCTHENM